MYADYEYYSGTYGGTVPEPDILPRLRQASRDVDTLTFGRIRAVGRLFPFIAILHDANDLADKTK